ncbi:MULTISPECIES: glycerate kinase type-2 family protein [Ramlibacter]|uniref:DUF4147 domain-containing protein n=1 Tax=Ramlibacter pinisoli TaxID=2682844 RepID=A0A6N8J0E7_9BURK|nr:MULTISPECIES: glycerate kinase [Ramlibacter]MBA2962826.1 glycerate kinase [Ramlibacter sp. CGMCC 1.13660]MVQ32769.1 DUF4147 domain-containing protein [Ramlibacter pinisoli]
MSHLPQGIQPKRFLTELFRAAVERALPAHNMREYLPQPPSGRTLVLGAGKAAAAMAQALEALWPCDKPLSGLVVTRYDHTPPTPATRRIEGIEAAHPVADTAGLLAAQRMLNLASDLTANDLVIFLVSGGGSALLCSPAAGIDLGHKQQITRQLLLSGASIGEMNCVRTHLSAVKGGRLALACYPAKVVTLAISDVPGDDPAVIASGPTIADSTSCQDALEVLRRHNIDIPARIRALLDSGRSETPKPGDVRFSGHEVHVIATPRSSLEAAARVARELGVPAHILGDAIEGEAREVGKVHAAIAQSVRMHGLPFATPCVILSGGETTVTVRPHDSKKSGRGGRAGECALGIAQALQGRTGIWALAADTDGIDGVESNAGAFVAPDTLHRAAALGLRIDNALAAHDSYGFFHALDDLVVTGPTFTNVNDFRSVLIA